MIKKIFLIFLVSLGLITEAQAQLGPSSNGPFYGPNWVQGYIPSPAQWQLLWTNKMDYFPSGLPIQYGGCGATTVAGCLSNLGVASLVLNSGQMFVGNSFNATSAVTPTGDWSVTNSGGTLVTSLSHVTDSSLANSGLVHPSLTVNGVNIALGASGTITAVPSGIVSTTLGGSGINNAGTLTWGAGGTLPSGSAAYQSIGTSGASVPLLSTGNTWTLAQKIVGASTTQPGWEAWLSGDTFARVAIGLNATDTPRLGLGSGSAARDVFLSRAGPANPRFGSDDAASPVAQTISMQNVLTGTSNVAGANTTFVGSIGTGTGAGGKFTFQTAAASTSGTSQNTATTAFTIEPTGAVTLRGIVENGCSPTITSNTLIIDLSVSCGTVFQVTNNANINTLNIVNTPGNYTAFTVRFFGNGTAFTQSALAGGSFHYPNSTPPVFSTGTGVWDVTTFITFDGGSNWTVLVGGQNIQ